MWNNIRIIARRLGRAMMPVFTAILRTFWWIVIQATKYVSRAAVWAAREMGLRARARVKRMLAPWLWPIAGVIVLAVLYGAIGRDGFIVLLEPLMVLGMICFGLWLMIRAALPRKKR